MRIIVESNNNSKLSAMLKNIMFEYCGELFQGLKNESLVIHHKDGDNANYTPENLCIMKRSDHSSYHNKYVEGNRLTGKFLTSSENNAKLGLEKLKEYMYVDVTDILTEFVKKLNSTVFSDDERDK